MGRVIGRSWYSWLENKEDRAVEIRGLPRVKDRPVREMQLVDSVSEQ
jgi:hypothetical protein